MEFNIAEISIAAIGHFLTGEDDEGKYVSVAEAS